MHPFHMLGNLYASISEQNTQNFFGLFYTVAQYFRSVFRNSETRLYGENSLALSGVSSRINTLAGFQHFFCVDSLNNSHEKNEKSLSSVPEKENKENNPVLQLIAPQQLPGIYLIRCKKNNKCYFGQSQNVSTRLSQHKSRLRQNRHDLDELQQDFILYGEQHFEFFAIFYFERSCSKEQRVELETQYINQFQKSCYNKFNKTSHKKENNPFWGKKHSPETIQQISKSIRENNQNSAPSGRSVSLNGTVYPSITESSKQTSHSRDTIRRWLLDKKKPSCFFLQNDSSCFSLSEEQENPDQPFVDLAAGENFKPVSFMNENTGFPKKVSLYGVAYTSIAEAARQRECSRTNIQRLLRTFPKDCFFIE